MGVPSQTGPGMLGRLLPLSGVVFVVGTVVAIVGVGGDTPDGNASAAKVSSFYQAHQNRQNVAAFILAAAVLFLVLFGAVFFRAVWRSGRREIWPSVLAAGTVLAAGAFVVSAFVHFALADSADTVTSSTVQGLNALDADSWVLFNPCLGVMMLGAAGSLIPSAGRYRTLGWIALPVGIAMFIPFADFFALLLTGIWILVVSVMLYRRPPAFADQPA
jgi:uncharacterized membrane protein YidH (DUF202 family)